MKYIAVKVLSPFSESLMNVSQCLAISWYFTLIIIKFLYLNLKFIMET